MTRYLKIKHSHYEEQTIRKWFKDNSYAYAVTGMSNNPEVDPSIMRVMFVELFSEEAELATRLKWKVV